MEPGPMKLLMTEAKPWNHRVNVARTPKSQPIEYCVSYSRLWPDGTRTDHTLTVDAYNPWAAETAFYWRVSQPEGVEQTIISVKPQTDTFH